jgi:hypothetical protein
MILLKAKHIQFPEYHKVYHLNMLGNFIDYRRKQSTSSQTMRLESLMKDLDENGMTHPIIVSWNAYNVSVGHQRVWYAKEKGYTHIDCYHIENQKQWEQVFQYTQSDEYWQKNEVSSRYADL